METAVLALAASAALSLTSMGAAAGETENWPYQTEVQDEGQRETGQRRKIGKIHLIFDADLGIGNDGKQVLVTADGSNRERYSIEDIQVVNEEWEFSNANPPELEITLVSEDEDMWYFFFCFIVKFSIETGRHHQKPDMKRSDLSAPKGRRTTAF